MTNQKLVTQFKKYLQDPLIQIALEKESFAKDVQDFYGIKAWMYHTRYFKHRAFSIEKEDPSKRGKKPTELIRILKTFEREANLKYLTERFKDPIINEEKLSYDSVRRDYPKWINNSRELKELGNHLGALATSIGGGIGGLHLTTNGNPEIGSLTIALGLGAALVIALKGKIKDPKDTNYEFWEFRKLMNCAEAADDFLKTRYKK